MRDIGVDAYMILICLNRMSNQCGENNDKRARYFLQFLSIFEFIKWNSYYYNNSSHNKIVPTLISLKLKLNIIFVVTPKDKYHIWGRYNYKPFTHMVGMWLWQMWQIVVAYAKIPFKIMGLITFHADAGTSMLNLFCLNYLKHCLFLKIRWWMTKWHGHVMNSKTQAFLLFYKARLFHFAKYSHFPLNPPTRRISLWKHLTYLVTRHSLSNHVRLTCLQTKPMLYFHFWFEPQLEILSFAGLQGQRIC